MASTASTVRAVPFTAIRSSVDIFGACATALLALTGTTHGSYSPKHVYQINRAGLYGPDQTSIQGIQISNAQFLASTGQIAGRSARYAGSFATPGQDTWVYNPLTNSTAQTGLVGGVYAEPDGTQVSENVLQNDAGQVAGHSQRYSGFASRGRDAWVYNPSTNTSVQIGLVGGVYTGSVGFQSSQINAQNSAGIIAGTSNRYAGVNTDLGHDAWVYNPNTNATTQIGLSGGAYTGSAGFQRSFIGLQNDLGHVAGRSTRYIDLQTPHGQDAWFYNPTTNTTVQIGLTGGVYAGSAGFQASSTIFQNQAGQIAGSSARIRNTSTLNGEDVWVYNPDTNATIQIGLTGGVYTGSQGRQESVVEELSEAGQVAGYSRRYSGVSIDLGRDAWVYNPVTNASAQVGFAGGVYTGSAGYQASDIGLQAQSGQVTGTSARITGANTFNGRDAWVYNPSSNTTVQIGFTGGVYTGSAGFQASESDLQNEAGQIVGSSRRLMGVSTTNGQDTWAYNPAAGAIVQTGLIGGVHTGSAGYQDSSNDFQNEFGQVVGHSLRYTSLNTQIGQDAWYFDPITQNTLQPTLGVPDSIRTSDNLSFSQPLLLTDDGFMLGYYLQFAGGMNPSVDRAFIYRPDLGFSDLGELVDGGLSAAGWDTLLRPQFQSAMQFIVGEGYFAGQTGNSRSVFVMRLVPAPGAASLLALGGILAVRRRR